MTVSYAPGNRASTLGRRSLEDGVDLVCVQQTTTLSGKWEGPLRMCEDRSNHRREDLAPSTHAGTAESKGKGLAVSHEPGFRTSTQGCPSLRDGASRVHVKQQPPYEEDSANGDHR